jgi:hypothetical protein
MANQAFNPSTPGRTANSTANQRAKPPPLTAAEPGAADQGGGGSGMGEAHIPLTDRQPQKILDKAFPYSEERLASALNVPRGDLRLIRAYHLAAGVDYEKKHGEVLLSEEALKRVLHCKALKPGDLDLSACLPVEKKEVSLNRTLEMTISKIPINPRMVLACFENDPEPHLVDVGRNFTFAIGDKIQVADHEIAKGVYELRSPVPRDRRRPWGLWHE